jgi:hypothetical protein
MTGSSGVGVHVQLTMEIVGDLALGGVRILRLNSCLERGASMTTYQLNEVKDIAVQTRDTGTLDNPTSPTRAVRMCTCSSLIPHGHGEMTCT